MVDQPWKMPLETGQGMRDQPSITRHAEQMFVQRLLGAAIGIGIGIQTGTAIALDPLR